MHKVSLHIYIYLSDSIALLECKCWSYPIMYINHELISYANILYCISTLLLFKADRKFGGTLGHRKLGCRLEEVNTFDCFLRCLPVEHTSLWTWQTQLPGVSNVYTLCNGCAYIDCFILLAMQHGGLLHPGYRTKMVIGHFFTKQQYRHGSAFYNW